MVAQSPLPWLWLAGVPVLAVKAGSRHDAPMRFLIARLSALFALLCVALSAMPAMADPADIAAASRSVVRVVLIADNGESASLYAHGSGFAVAPDLVVTNAHVVAELADNPSLRLLVIPSEGSRGYVARVAAFSPRNDLALLRVADAKLTAATVSPAVAQDGQQVFAVGYPGNVDLAQGLDQVDMITPTPPVKVSGAISTGRSSRSFDTLLHTAPLAQGNSGGPLFDACGRVVGVNSFGTVTEGSGSDFFFAITMRELLPFLRGAGVTIRSNNLPCQSMAEFDKAEAERLAGQRAQDEASARAAADKQENARDQAERRAQLEVFSARETGLILAALALLGSLAAGGAAFWFGQQGKPRERKFATIGAAILGLAAVVAFATRPSVDSIEERTQELLGKAEPTASATEAAARLASGPMRCVLDPGRSRVTVSDLTDVPIDWGTDGCMNGRSQYGLDSDGWARILVPNSEQAVSVAKFDPAGRTYTVERYLPDLETMAKLREARGKFTPPSCGGGEAAARKLGDDQGALKALLPAQPNERLVYNCSADKGGGD